MCYWGIGYADSSGSRTDSNNDSMNVNDFDMNYVGVYDVWNNDLGEICI